MPGLFTGETMFGPMPSGLLAPKSITADLLADGVVNRLSSSGLSTARPASPSTGQIFYETDTGIERVWTGSEWRRIAPPGVAHARSVVVPGSTSSATYVDFPGNFNIAFTKRSASTSLLVHVSGSTYCGVAANMVTNIGVRIASTDMDVTYFFHNAVSRHDSFAGTALGFPGLAAGGYTALLRWKMGGTGGSIHADANDLFTLTVQEVTGT